MTARRFSVAVAGASGYAGAEAARLLLAHPGLKLGAMAAHSHAGQDVAGHLPHLAAALAAQGRAGETFVDLDRATLADHDAVVLALPHGTSASLANEIADLNPEAVVVDAGADFRLESAHDWRAWYGSDHAGTWTYGLPELPLVGGGRQRDLLVGARRIAGPGCNASAVALGLAPVVAAGLVGAQGLNAVLPVGTSGAGRGGRADLLHSQIAGGARPYATGSAHRHVPEILQSLRKAGAPETTSLAMTPVLVPMRRGILAVCTGQVRGTATSHDVVTALQQAYGDETFVTVLPEGSLADTHPVMGSNVVQISADVDPASGVVSVIVALDNLVKGTAGALVQCLNLALGLPETSGLPLTGLAP